jgi:TRAP-type C4-dicarboxylate transport system substrate-binding protein
MTSNSVRLSLIGACAAAALAGATSGTAKEWKLTAGSSHPPILPWVATIPKLVVPESNRMLKELGLPDTIKWTEAYAGALYDFNNTLEGVGDGLADVGWVGTLWEPAKMPLHNVSYYAPFVTGDVYALMEIQEEMERNIPAFRDEWTKHNTIYLGAQVADTYHLVSKFPFTKFSDLQGKKILAGGAIANWLQGTGATAVDAGLPVQYNMLQTGVADATIIIITGVVPFKLHEVAPYVTKVDIGGVISGALAMNKKTWESLTPHMKMLFRYLGREYARRQTDLVAENVAKSWAALEKFPNVKISELPAEEKAKWVNALPDLAGDWVKRNGEPAKQVLKTLMDGARQRGNKPIREWDKGL